METGIQRTDAEARLVLPARFADSTVIIEQVSETELRIRRVKVGSDGDRPFEEELRTALSDEDRERVLEILANPKAPNAALGAAAARHKAR